MNVVDWIRETANYMMDERPDIFDYDKASAQLIEHMEFLRSEYPGISPSAIMSGSFILMRLVEDEGREEFQLTQYVSSVTTFLPEEDCVVLGNPFLDINLPGPGDFSDETLDSDDED